MKSWYSSLFLIGINNSKLSNSEIKRIKLFNAFCYCWYATAVILILNYLTKSPFQLINVIAHLVQATIIFIAQYLHSRGKYETGRFLFAFMLIANSFLFSNFLRTGQLLEFYMILPPAVSLVLTDNKKINYSILGISFLGFVLPNLYFNHYPKINFYSPALICLFLLYYFLTNYFKKQNKKIEGLLEIERDKVIADKIILEEQKNKLNQLNEFKSHFFVNFSHEIRTPLTLIRGNVSRINLNDTIEENKVRIKIINSQINQIQNIISNIIDLSRIDANQFSIHCTKVALHPFLKRHFQEFKELFEKKEIMFSLQTELQEIEIFMDENLISKSINNLLSNALKFTPKKGTVEIIVQINNLDESLQIIIKDNGIGIPENDLEKVFERFYQSKNDITKSQGSGIGLSFTQSIIEAHEFKINLSSIPNQATVFTITIPRESFNFIQTIGDKLEKNIPTPTTLKNNISLKIDNKRTILIVDDNEQMRNYLKEILNGYQITEAENGAEALVTLQKKSFDIIITDYMMPVLDGEGLVLKIKEFDTKTPILVLTARSDQEGKLKMLRLGIDGYLNKPFIEEELHLLIKKSFESLDNLNSFEVSLEDEEKESLKVFANKFNEELNDIIYKNLHSPTFGVEDIAFQLEISKSTLNRKTKAILGQTTLEIIMEARFQKAKSLLSENPYASKKEIAEKVGITNATYFFNKFNERFGISS